MSAPQAPFHEANLGSTSIRDLGLTIAGTPLEPILAQFEIELQQAGIRRLRPHFYLTTEWGVPFETVAIGIPFYLARPDLTAFHAEHHGHVEGLGQADILRYLRHEMGHVVNYAYRLYDREEWVKLFGSMEHAYEEEYRPVPFSQRFVEHLPGWYAQKHPDEDWAETFAVWMTPGQDWRTDYAHRPVVLTKLDWCDRTMAALADQAPLVTAADLDEEVSSLTCSLEQFYRTLALEKDDSIPGLDSALRTVFGDLGQPDGSSVGSRRPASTLIRRLERDLMANVYRWTGHFPERTRVLLRQLANRADSLRQTYPEESEALAIVALTTLVTALAMNHVHRGTYWS